MQRCKTQLRTEENLDASAICPRGHEMTQTIEVASFVERPAKSNFYCKFIEQYRYHQNKYMLSLLIKNRKYAILPFLCVQRLYS